MKAMNLVLVSILALAAQTTLASGTGDIGSGTEKKLVAACYSLALDVEVSTQGNYLLIDVTGNDEVTVRYSRELAAGEVLNGRSLTTYAISKPIGSHNVIGEGSMINIKGNEAVFSNGVIHSLTCQNLK